MAQNARMDDAVIDGPADGRTVLGHPIGVCGWSLHPDGTADLIARVRRLGLTHLQLALSPLTKLADEDRADAVALLRDSGLTLAAGMISFEGEDYSTLGTIRQTGGFDPDDRWPQRRAHVGACAAVAADLGVELVSTHIGFVPASNSDAYRTMLERTADAADLLAARGATLLVETGPEPAAVLLQFLNDLRARTVGVNFDPANMILYGMGDPIEALRTLGHKVRHVHVKDAVASAQRGVEWGREVPFGRGQVNPTEFLTAIEQVGYGGPLTVEREAGEDRMADVMTAIESLAAAERVMTGAAEHEAA